MIVSFLWTQTLGPAVTLSNAAGAQPTFPAPVVNAAGVALEFELRVTNAAGLAATDRVIVNVSDALPPVADAGPADRPGMHPGRPSTAPTPATLAGRLSAFSGRSLRVPPSPVQCGRGTTTFSAPAVSSARAALEFELRVTNAAGRPATDRVTITVFDAPHVAEAGPLQTVPEFSTLVTLDGTNSSNPGGVWSAFSGRRSRGPPSPCSMRPGPDPPLSLPMWTLAGPP